MVADGVKNGIKGYVTERIKLLNPFTLPQLIWMVELYYLMLNSLLLIIEKEPNIKTIISGFPKEFFMYNKLINQYLLEWSTPVAFLGVGLLFSGIIISMVNKFPYVSDFKIVNTYSNYGVSACVWMILIWLTYRLFLLFSAWFPIVIVVLFYIFIVWEQAKEGIQNKLGYSKRL